MPTIGRYRAITPQVDFRLLVYYDLTTFVQSGIDTDVGVAEFLQAFVTRWENELNPVNA